jgi:hypothetical protein
VDRTTLYASPIPECCLLNVSGSDNSSRGVEQKKVDAMLLCFAFAFVLCFVMLCLSDLLLLYEQSKKVANDRYCYQQQQQQQQHKD